MKLSESELPAKGCSVASLGVARHLKLFSEYFASGYCTILLIPEIRANFDSDKKVVIANLFFFCLEESIVCVCVCVCVCVDLNGFVGDWLFFGYAKVSLCWRLEHEALMRESLHRG